MQSGDVAWTCHACGTSANAAATAALLALGRAHAGSDWPRVCEWVEAQGWVSPESDAVPAVQVVEVRGLLPVLPAPVLVEVWGERIGLELGVALAAVEAGVPDDYALDGARDYLDARESQVLPAGELHRWRAAHTVADSQVVDIDTVRAVFGRRWRQVLQMESPNPRGKT